MRRAYASTHACGFEKCQNCHESVEIGSHQCYMQQQIAKGGRCGDEECSKCGSKPASTPRAKKRDEKCSYTEDYIFFDYEAQQETWIHVANLIVAYDFPGNQSVFHTNDDFC